MNEQNQDIEGQSEAEEQSDPQEQPMQPMQADKDPKLRAEVGGYRTKRRTGWYIALLLLGFGLGAALALVVGQSMRDTTSATPTEVSGDTPTDRVAPTLRSGLVFSSDETAPAETPDMFDTAIPQIYCHFRIRDVESIESLSAQCLHEGDEFLQLSGEAFTGTVEEEIATGHVVIEPPEGDTFSPGIYEVTVTTSGGSEHTASFVMVEEAGDLQQSGEQTVKISDVATCGDIAEDGTPLEVTSTFSADVEKIFVSFRYSEARPGSTVEARWYRDDEELPGSGDTITLPSRDGVAHAWMSPGDDGRLPEGEYGVSILPQSGAEALVKVSFEILSD